MKTPKFLQKLMQSPAYMNRNSKEYVMAEKYLHVLYPGKLIRDASGRMTAPEYDMTLAQFKAAQYGLNVALDESKTEVEDEYYEATGRDIDVDSYVELDETIDVRVLMPDGRIVNKRLEIYTLNIPEENEGTSKDKIKRIWRWHSEDSDKTCDVCASQDDEIYENEDDIPEVPVHPNCRCIITQDVIAPDGKKVSSKPYTPKKNGIREMTQDEKFEEAYNKLKEPEGKYTDGKNQVRDEPTNMGIKQSTLDDYAKKHPEKDLPNDVKYLAPSQAKEIYKNMYWDNTKIPQIENDRVRNAVFDMNVMGGAGKVVQTALNYFGDVHLAIDGKIGSLTVDALNSIPDNKVAEFMDVLKTERLEYLQKTENWPTAKNGWTKRTNKY